MSGVEEGQRFFDPGLSVPKVDVSGLRWLDADDARLALEGFWWRRPGGAFRRLPPSGAARPLPAGVDGLAWHSSGGCLRFRSDCSRIVVRARMASANLIVRMAMTGSMGFDLYADGTCRGVTRFRIGEGDFVADVFSHGERRMRDFTLYFPTYARLTSLELGVNAQARFEEPRAWPDPRPIVAYGTSILQGACANRPGMAYTNLLSRTLDRPVLNFGFAGNGRGEAVMAETLAEIDRPALYLLDYDANVSHDLLAATLTPFCRILRAAHPETPILTLSRTPMTEDLPQSPESSWPSGCLLRYWDIHRQSRDELRAGGDRRVHCLDGSGLLGADWWDCLVDGVHLTDLGYQRLVQAIAPEIRRILGGC